MSETSTPSDAPEGWPDCDPEQVEVMLLGTIHLDNPGLDEINPRVGDVLTPERQSELRDLTERLARWDPDRIAVERPYDDREAVNAVYEEFRDGRRAYDEEQDLSSLRADFGVELDDEVRSEVVQVGFRLADELGHDRVYPIDAPTTLQNDEFDALEERGFRPEKKVDYSLPDPEAVQRETEEKIADSTLTEFLRWQNQEEQLRVNHDLMFDRGVRWGEGDNFGGPRRLTIWYDRNLRMVHNVWRALESDDERVLFLVGSGHVRVLRHLFTEAPMFCPVSPLPYLAP